MAAVGPVCHIPPVTVTTQPKPVNLPNIPPAGPTIDSLVATVNALRQNLIFITGRQGPQGPQGGQGAAAKKGPPARWTENVRVTETVRIYDPNDKETFVDVERINQLVMNDQVTGEKWTWDRDRK